jgi:hypothetical protein
MPLGVVDLAEIIEVDDRQRQPRVISRRGEPLALQLLLEGAVVAQTREGVAQRLGAGAGLCVHE